MDKIQICASNNKNLNPLLYVKNSKLIFVKENIIINH